eukprot:s4621_g4.t1
MAASACARLERLERLERAARCKKRQRVFQWPCLAWFGVTLAILPPCRFAVSNFCSHAGSSERSSNRGRTVGHAKSKDGQDESLDANKLVFLDEEDYVRLFRTELQEQERRAILRRKRCFLPFDDCVKWVRAMGLWDNQEEWEEWIEMGEKRNPYIPSRPDQYYGELGQWKGWAYFLGAPGTEASPDREGTT